METQLRFAKLSMALLEKGTPQNKKPVEKEQFSYLDAAHLIRQIGDEICRLAVVHEPEEDVNWSGTILL